MVLDYKVDFSLKIGQFVYFLLRLDNMYVLVHVFFTRYLLIYSVLSGIAIM